MGANGGSGFATAPVLKSNVVPGVSNGVRIALRGDLDNAIQRRAPTELTMVLSVISSLSPLLRVDLLEGRLRPLVSDPTVGVEIIEPLVRYGATVDSGVYGAAKREDVKEVLRRYLNGERRDTLPSTGGQIGSISPL